MFNVLNELMLHQSFVAAMAWDCLGTGDDTTEEECFQFQYLIEELKLLTLSCIPF